MNREMEKKRRKTEQWRGVMNGQENRKQLPLVAAVEINNGCRGGGGRR